MDYAIIRSGAKQYKVSKGSIIEVDKVLIEKGKEIELEDILLIVENGKVDIGKPTVKNAKIRAKVLDQIKGEKIRVAKFKAKVRYRRVIGFRPLLTRLQIEEIIH